MQLVVQDAEDFSGGLFEDEDTRVFYEVLPDLRPLMPGAMLSQEEGEADALPGDADVDAPSADSMAGAGDDAATHAAPPERGAPTVAQAAADGQADRPEGAFCCLTCVAFNSFEWYSSVLR